MVQLRPSSLSSAHTRTVLCTGSPYTSQGHLQQSLTGIGARKSYAWRRIVANVAEVALHAAEQPQRPLLALENGVKEALLSSGWQHLPHHLRAEALWLAIREEAREDAEVEPALASFLHTSILTHGSLAKSMAFMLANKLSSRTLLGTQLMRLITAAYEDDPGIMDACYADVQAVRERDAACDKFLHCILYYKGFQAVQCHRVAHWLWKNGRQTLAIAIQSRVSEVMEVDIHPAAQLGKGIMIDHATGVVVGETAVVGDNVSMLHHVTLGGSGTGKGKRHPTLGHGVLLGAGVCVLGPITVGAGSKVGAGSVVVTNLPCHCVAVGVPARIIKQNCTHEPCIDMDLVEDFILDYQI